MNSEIVAATALTVAARLTPAFPSAIATIAVHGPLAVEIVGRLVKCKHSPIDAFPLGRVRYGLWNAAEGMVAAEQVVVCRTHAQTIEIHCHGGHAVCQMILNDLVTHGCQQVATIDFPLEFNCEFQREAAMDLQRATTDRAAAILLDQLNGALGHAIATIAERFRSQGAAAVRSNVEELLRWSDLGLHLAEPWQVVLAGPPNAGKSSVLNAIVGSERVIVHRDPGTTRDWVDVLTAIDGWPIALSDTAGIRDSADAIEAEGIRRALQRVAAAELVVFVVDATVGWTDTHERLKAAAAGKRTLIAWNKIDLSEGLLCPLEAIRTSASVGIGMAELLAAIAHQLVPILPPPSAAVPFRLRHVQYLESLISS